MTRPIIPRRFFPLTANALRQVRPTPPLEDVAVNTVEICPEERIHLPPVRILEGERSKIAGTMLGKPLARELAVLEGGEFTYQALKRYEFKDVLATPFGFFSPSAALNRRLNYPARALLAPVHHEASGLNAAPKLAFEYFGHWVRDALAIAAGSVSGEKIYLPVRKDWAHAADYVAATGVERIPADYVAFDRMYFYNNFWPNRFAIDRLKTLHDRIQSRAGQGGASGVYFSRGSTGLSRTLVNEAALIEALSGMGFAIIDTREPLESIWHKAAGASTVVSVEGSHYVNAFLAAKPGAAHILINPSDQFNLYYSHYMPAVSGRMATTVAAREGDSYRVDVDAVRALIDLTAS